MKLALTLLTSAGTLLVMWLAGNGDRRAWKLGIANNGLWWVYTYTRGEWGLVPLNAVLLVVYIRNLRRTRPGVGTCVR